MKTQACIWLSPEVRATLEGWVADRNTPQKLVWRSRIVLMSADGVGKMAIVRAVGKSKRTVDRWQDRFITHGLAGLQRDATRRGRKPPLAASVIEKVVHMTLHEKPPAATHWSARRLAKAAGISHTSRFPAFRRSIAKNATASMALRCRERAPSTTSDSAAPTA